MQNAVDEARRRQEILRAAQPTRFSQGDGGGFEATPHHGGFRASGGGNADEGEVGGAGAPGGKAGFDGGRGRAESFDRVADGPGGRSGEGAAQDRGDLLAGGEEGDGGRNAQGGASGGTNSVGSTFGQAPQTPLAATRGKNWSLKDATAGATAYTRPIQVQCFADKLVLVPERGAGQSPVTVPMTGATRSAIDPLVQAIWKRTESWGLAGNRAYWRPVLRVEVAKDAEDRFTDFQQLLEGSGMEIERKKP
jgi:hypothetical protein